MHDSGRTETVVRMPDGRLMQKRWDGRLHPLEDRTDLAAVDATSEEDIARQIAEGPDDPANDPDDPVRFPVVYPPPEERIAVRLDNDVSTGCAPRDQAIGHG